jgi:DinB superfamily
MTAPTKSVALARPEPDEYAGPFAGYVALVPEDAIVDVLTRQLDELRSLLEPLTESQAMVVHPPYTWTIKEVVGHVTDCERIFAYRALRAARGDATALPDFDENGYARQAAHSKIPQSELIADLTHVRQSNLHLFRHLDEAAWLRRVTATGAELSVRAWAHVIAGHARHHIRILQRRFGA